MNYMEFVEVEEYYNIDLKEEVNKINKELHLEEEVKNHQNMNKDYFGDTYIPEDYLY